jgi:hypothetical protein
MRVLERLGEFDIAGRELRRQGVRIGNVEVGVPACLRLPPTVGERIDTNALSMIIAPPRRTMPKKGASAGS